ncbi:hypothetical protein NI17_019545 [Thermobifida halotolerans]|uniref:Uncharacterized protein n=1 Tax=Thermobifida halotolerans TaxID=483545 RepID=A0A399FWS0_9ACTN|nr:hypothetical protein [Thermobifida halotolerans]UOE18938.1 hypothetical protein NI17_019545 [Thermobifida halotolerans]
MSYPVDDTEQLIEAVEKELPPSTRSRLIAKLRMGVHIDDAARELGVSPQRVFSAARVLGAFGAQLDATLTAERDPGLPHGTVTGYNKRCRCPDCRAALQRRI